jgi:2-C-methyl-D-erythritol 2,4-cyclodiphosphate synthase
MKKDSSAQLAAFRIGHGYDVHRFGEGEFIILAGVKIPYHHGFIAHSDGDVLIHSLCDALLGSVAEGDIGQHFPDNDEQYKNIDSRRLLARCDEIIKQRNYAVGNIDVTIIAQAPKMSAYIQAMRQQLSVVLDISISQINIKATTTEKLGFAGRQEGIAVHTVVMLYANVD